MLLGLLVQLILNWGGRSKYYVAAVLMLHVIVNLYTVANVLPATGIPLPFVGRALQNSVVLSALTEQLWERQLNMVLVVGGASAGITYLLK